MDDGSSTIAGGAAETIPQVLAATARRYPNRPALVDGDAPVTYDELHRRARAVAATLIDMGLDAGGSVALWGHNSNAWAIASLGVLAAGGTVVPVNARYTATEAADVIERARCRLVLAGGEGLGRDHAREAADFVARRRVVALSATAARHVAHLDDLPPPGASARVEVDARLRALTADDISHIQFTSGTTGRPKGAMLRHGAMTRTTADWVRAVGLCSEDRYPVVAPFSHIGGHKTGLLACITAGAALRPIVRLDIEALGRIIDEWRATMLQGPPTMFHALLAHQRAEGGRPSSIRIACTGAANVPPQLVRDLREVLGVARVVTSYGLTEATGVCTITGPDDSVDVIADTSGAAIAGVEVRVVGPSGDEVDNGHTGEIVVRGHNVMAGYLDDADATAEAIRDGWLHTGDVGSLSAEGNLRIVDRLKDMIIVGGFNVYPAEIEHALLDHPSVSQVAVIGAPDERMGEVPVAFVVPAVGHDLSTDPLVAFCQERLAKFKVPRTVVGVDALPLNASGKVSKVELRRRHRSAR